MKVMMMTDYELLEILKQNVDKQQIILSNGQIWDVVYLPNAQGNLTKHQFGGLLSSLKKKGLYRALAVDFGEVRIK